ncbi:type 1 phosphatases regulator YPI1 [Scheffersomyces xylosifermentans]|uniref:type 1 phosphatases regulator YPI1 n=1 Tax=Scheffersomyces xylosifermentans TaxID=1304137 RepID=UPI00315D306C
MMSQSTRNESVSTTQTITETQTVSPILHLRASRDKSKKSTKKSDKNDSRVSWAQGVTDNEHLNRKKSKICCIFHPQREFGESSDDSSSDSSSDSSDESDNENGFNSEGNNLGNNNNYKEYSHDHEPQAQKTDANDKEKEEDECCHHHHHHHHKHEQKKTKKVKKATPNAYEKQPRYQNKSTLPEEAI